MSVQEKVKSLPLCGRCRVNPQQIGDSRCENCWAKDQHYNHGRSQRVRIERDYPIYEERR